MKKKVELYDQKPIAFKVGQTHVISQMNGTLMGRSIYIISVIEDHYGTPEGSFTDVMVTYRWFSDYKGYWIYAVDTERGLSFMVRHHKKMMAAFRRSKKKRDGK